MQPGLRWRGLQKELSSPSPDEGCPTNHPAVSKMALLLRASLESDSGGSLDHQHFPLLRRNVSSLRGSGLQNLPSAVGLLGDPKTAATSLRLGSQ